MLSSYILPVFTNIKEGTTIQLSNYPSLKLVNRQWIPLFKHSVNHQLLLMSPSVSSLVLSITTATALV